MAGKKDTPQSPEEAAFAEVAYARFADYQKRWAPLQNKLISDVKEMGKGDSGERKRAAGQANVDSQVQFAAAGDQLEAAAGESAGTINSSKGKLGLAGFGADQAQSRGMGFVASDQAIDDAYLEGLSKITAMGRGESRAAMEGMGNTAQMGAAQAQKDAATSAARRAGYGQIAGQAAGFGMQAMMATKPGPTPGAGPTPATPAQNQGMINLFGGTG